MRGPHWAHLRETRHQYLLKSDKLTDVDEDSLLELYTPYLNENVQQESLSLLSEMLSKHHGTNAIILIDEYDVPLDKSHQKNYYTEMVEHIRRRIRICILQWSPDVFGLQKRAFLPD